MRYLVVIAKTNVNADFHFCINIEGMINIFGCEDVSYHNFLLLECTNKRRQI